MAGGPVATLRKWLRQRGWAEVRPWSWQKLGVGELLLEPGADLSRQLHQLRAGWRLFSWNQFLKNKRHEAQELRTAEVDPRNVFNRNFDLLRKICAAEPACRSVALCAVVSPAWFKDRQVESFPSTCPWCRALGTWKHIAWECRSSPLLSLRPRCPRDAIESRLGWPALRDRQAKVLRYLGTVQEAIRNCRWRPPEVQNEVDI